MTQERLAKEHMPDEARLKELLFGRKITNVEIREDESPDRWESGPTGYLTLDDGTILKVWGNDGGCACSSGCYPLATLNSVDNAITNVIVEERPDDDDSCPQCDKWSCEHRGWYKIFVVAEDHNQHLVASFEGSDGNGYYGTGWWLTVVPPTEEQGP